jgi:Phasin protein
LGAPFFLYPTRTEGLSASLSYEEATMAKAKEPPESLTGIARQTAEQITGRTQEAMENYFSWLHNAMLASPWGNTDLNKKLLSYATENASNAFGLVQKLSQAKTVEDVVKIQTGFMTAQFTLCNAQAKNIGEIYTRTMAAMMTPFGLST